MTTFRYKFLEFEVHPTGFGRQLCAKVFGRVIQNSCGQIESISEAELEQSIKAHIDGFNGLRTIDDVVSFINKQLSLGGYEESFGYHNSCSPALDKEQILFIHAVTNAFFNYKP